MASFNKVILIGNLVEEPQRRSTNSGVAVADMRLAINRHWTDRQGQAQKETCFIDVTAWDRLAEICFNYLKKGRPVMFEGYLKQETWDDKNNPGQKRSKIKVIAESMQLLGGPNDPPGQSHDDSESAPPPSRSSYSERPAPAASASSSGSSYRGNAGNGPASSGGRSSSNYGRASAPPMDEADEDIPF